MAGPTSAACEHPQPASALQQFPRDWHESVQSSSLAHGPSGANSGVPPRFSSSRSGVGFEGEAVTAWQAMYVFFQDKMRTLFSMLFGASIFLIGGERADAARGKVLRRRLFWLAVFGLVHGLAFWFGDILLLYAWTGLFVMLAAVMYMTRRVNWWGQVPLRPAAGSGLVTALPREGA